MQVVITLSSAATSDDVMTLTIAEEQGGERITVVRNAVQGGGQVAFDPIDVTSLDDGLLSLTVELANAAGTSLFDFAPVLKDTVLPAAPLGGSIPGVPGTGGGFLPVDTINAASAETTRVEVRFAAASSSEDSIQLTFQDEEKATALFGFAGVEGAGTFLTDGIDLSSLADGQVTIAGVVQDGANNSVEFQLPTALKDTVLGGATEGTVAEGASNPEAFVNQASVDAAVVRILLPEESVETDQASLVIFDGLDRVTTSPLSPLGGANSLLFEDLDLSSLADGPLTLAAIVRDAAGNFAELALTPATKDTVIGGATGLRIVAGTDNPQDVINAASQGNVIVAAELDGDVLNSDQLQLEVTDGVTEVTFERAAESGPATVNLGPFDASVVQDGAVDLVLTLSDAAGNVREVPLGEVLKDTVIPAAPVGVEVPAGANNPAGFVNAFSQSTSTFRVLGGAGEDPDRFVELRVRAGASEIVRSRLAANADAVIVFTGLDLTTFPEGTLSLEVDARDAAGNRSATLEGGALLDRSISGPTEVLVPAGPDNDQNVITAAIEAAISLRLVFPASVAGGDQVLASLYDGLSLIALPDATIPPGGADLVFNGIDTTGLDDGTVTFAGTVEDQAGNVVSIGPFVFDKDTTSPGAPISANVGGGPDNDQDVINQASVGAVEVVVDLPETYDGTETVRVVVESPGGASVSAPAITAPAGGGIVTFGPLDTSGLADGIAGLTVEVTDASSNTASFAGTSALKDVVSPTPPASTVVAEGLFNPANMINFDSQGAVQVIVDLSDDFVGDEEVQVRLTDQLLANRESDIQVAPVGGGPLAFAAIDASSLTDGDLTLSVAITDGAGNAIDVASGLAVKDVLFPEVLGASIPPTSASALNVVTAIDVAAVTAALSFGPDVGAADTAVVRVDDGLESIESTPFPASQSTIADLDLTSLADGPLTLTVTLTDAAQNVTELEAATVLKQAQRDAARFAFVASRLDSTLTVLQVEDEDEGELVRPTTFAVPDEAPMDVAVDYEARFVHTAGGELGVAGTISTFLVDPITGELEPVDSTLTGAQPRSLALHPNGEYLVVACEGSNEVQSFRIDSVDGTLAPVSTETANTSPGRIAMDPAGRFVFVLDTGSSEVWTFAINPATGALAPGLSTSLPAAPTGIAVHPSGLFLYVGRSSTVSIFGIDQESGELASLGSATAPSGDVDLVVRADGRFLYTTSLANAGLRAFRIDGAGLLTSVAGPIGLSGSPDGLAIGPMGTGLFVGSAQEAELQIFDIDGSSGVPALRQRQRTRGTGELSISVDQRGVQRSPRLLYAVHAAAESLDPYVVDAQTGALSIGGAGASVGGDPAGLALDSEAGLAFVVNEGSDSVTRLRLDPVTGEPSALGQVPSGLAPFGAALDLSGRFLFISNGGADSVSSYAVNRATGGLTALGDVLTGVAPGRIAADPTGRFAYVVNRGDSTLSGYRIDPAMGSLTPTSAPTVASGGQGAVQTIIHPSGRVLYVTNSSSNNVTPFRIDAVTGNLDPLGQPVVAGNGPGPLAVDPKGEYLFVGNVGDGDISVYEISSVTGALVPVVGPQALVGANIGSLAVDPSGRFVHASEPSSDLIVTFLLNRSNGTLSQIDAQGAVAGQPNGLGAAGAVQ